MASHIKRGESLFIPFRDGQSIADSQLRPRMYKSIQNFEKAFPKHYLGTDNIEMVEYAEVKHGEWENNGGFYRCSECINYTDYDYDYCPYCGAKMDGKE